MLINAYAADRGWLFEDLKEAFGAFDGLEGVEVRGTNDPLPNADAWICIRTDEMGRSPDPLRTVVQIHDFWPHEDLFGLEVGALSRVHSGQIPGLGHTKSLTLPIGARRAFRLRSSMPDQFTVGWVGRDMRGPYRTSVKRPAILGEALAELRGDGFDVRCIALTQDSATAADLGATEIWTPRMRRTATLDQLQSFYHAIDALVVTSPPEPGPLSIFEALRCGVPVILPIGHLTAGEEDRLLIAGAIETCSMPSWMLAYVLKRFDREAHFKRREQIRDSMQHFQEDWISANVELAVELASAHAHQGRTDG